MEHRLFVHVDRSESLKEDVTVYKHKYSPNSGDTIIDKIDLKSGEAVTTQYFVDAYYQTSEKLTDDDLYNLNNAFKALIVMKGEECIDEKTIAQFLKANTGIAIKNIKITAADKTYISTYRVGGKYYSDEIDLLANTTTKNV